MADRKITATSFQPMNYFARVFFTLMFAAGLIARVSWTCLGVILGRGVSLQAPGNRGLDVFDAHPRGDRSSKEAMVAEGPEAARGIHG